MSEEHPRDKHSSLIKTPKQLIVVIALAFLVPITVIVMLVYLATSSVEVSENNPAFSDDMIAQRLKPVGEVAVVDPNAPRVERTGKEVVDRVCAACHTPGVLGAPKMGDNAAWRKHIAEGLPHLSENAIKGIRQMPPRGGDPDLSDLEVTRAVAYMANQSGANFKEPEGKPVSLPAKSDSIKETAAPAGKSR